MLDHTVWPIISINPLKNPKLRKFVQTWPLKQSSLRFIIEIKVKTKIFDINERVEPELGSNRGHRVHNNIDDTFTFHNNI